MSHAWKLALGRFAAIGLLASAFLPLSAAALTVQFFSSNQVASLVSTGVTSDTISSEGYLFTYTRDKLFTGGIGLTNPIGRYVRVSWPGGVEAQAVTAGPNPGKARITVSRVDGQPFNLVSFTAYLLANTSGAGGSIEVMPKRNGEDAFNDPLYFPASGSYGNSFSYSTNTPGYLGNTSALTNYEAYVINLYVDFALTALRLDSADPPPTNHAPTGLQLSANTILENEPPDTWVGAFTAIDPDPADSFSYALVDGPGGDDNHLFYLVDGNLFAGSSFNFEQQNTFSIRVETADQDLLSTQQVFAIHVLDVDEPPPETGYVSLPDGGEWVLTWGSIPNHAYAVWTTTNLTEGFTLVESAVPATPPVNLYTVWPNASACQIWMVTTDP